MNDQEFASSIQHAQHQQPGPATLSAWGRIKRGLKIRFRDPEQGGYVHDTNMSQFFSPAQALHTVGTWTPTVGNVALTYMMRRTAAGATNQLVYLITPPQNAIGLKGAYLKSIDLWYENATADLTTLTPALDLATLPPTSAATGTAFGAPAAQTITFDAAHTAPLRVAIGKHHLTATITTPWWLGPNDLVYFDVTIVAAASSVYDDYGCRANYTLRI